MQSKAKLNAIRCDAMIMTETQQHIDDEGEPWFDDSDTAPLPLLSVKHDEGSRKGCCCRYGRATPTTTKDVDAYPPSVRYIIAMEGAERFSFYGLKAVLVLYFIDYLHFGEDRATSLYHTFVMLCYFTPLIGGIISDSFIGKYRTIAYLSLMYVIGTAILAITSIPAVSGTPPHWWGTIIGLVMISFATGGIKAPTGAFGAEQLDRPEHVESFFSLFYFAINTGALLSILITPKLRGDVSCFGGTECFPLAFGVSSICMMIAAAIFVAGYKKYKRRVPEGNVTVMVFKAICCAITTRIRAPHSSARKNHWLDWAADKYDKKDISDIKAFLRVVLMLSPVFVFWALFDQQGSRWTLQARQMNGSLGALGEIKPDQMQAANSILVVILIPVFDKLVYPLVRRCGFQLRPLRKMCIGMGLAASAFVVSGLVQLHIDSSTVEFLPLHSHDVRFRVLNAEIPSATGSGPIYWKTDDINYEDPIFPMNASSYVDLSASEKRVNITGSEFNTSVILSFDPRHFYTVVLVNASYTFTTRDLLDDEDPNDRSGDHESDGDDDADPLAGMARIRLLVATELLGDIGFLRIRYGPNHSSDICSLVAPFTASNYSSIPAKSGYYVSAVVDNSTVATFEDITFRDGAAFTILLSGNNVSAIITEISPKPVSMFLQLPQYIIMTSGEVLFSVPGLEFAFSQSPNSMKAMCQAIWLLTVAMGNVLVVIVSESQFFSSQAKEFFFFAGTMGCVLVIFMILAIRYEYVDDVSSQHYHKSASNGDEYQAIAHRDDDKTTTQ